VSCLGLVGGGTHGSTVIAPNNPTQYVAVITRLVHIESDPFFQVRPGSAAGEGLCLLAS
jgi:hypothetical protein